MRLPMPALLLLALCAGCATTSPPDEDASIPGGREAVAGMMPCRTTLADIEPASPARAATAGWATCAC